MYIAGLVLQNLPPDAIFCDHASEVYYEWYSVVHEAYLCKSSQIMPTEKGSDWKQMTKTKMKRNNELLKRSHAGS